ncbi:MAG: MBL fold metallo-hydrolase [Clostridiales bacterium]|jgi:glyoxylase-like metal-dependent hydrolase (beta-lactamase superfamily II)|nr:MBL fold metallo-hydrolase [Clostridiales bacterium]
MIVKRLVLGAIAANCYVCYNEGGNSCVLVDPGGDPAKIAGFLNKNALALEAVLLTHGHFDHIAAIPELKSHFKFNFKIYAHEKEETVLSDGGINLSSMVFGEEISLKADVLLKDSDVFSVAGLEFKIINTPGHTAGSSCFINFGDEIVFTGDTLFRNGIGRTDLPSSEPSKIKLSIKNKLFTLGDNFIVYPGHDEQTTIGYEKAHNRLV